MQKKLKEAALLREADAAAQRELEEKQAKDADLFRADVRWALKQNRKAHCEPQMQLPPFSPKRPRVLPQGDARFLKKKGPSLCVRRVWKHRQVQLLEKLHEFSSLG